jgi:ankyrin repeat protein
MLFDHGRGDVHRGQLLHNAVLRKGPESEVIQLIMLLLSKGAYINEVQYSKHAPSWALHSPFGLGTPLHYAVEQNKLAVASCLLDNGADPTIADSNGRTVLEVATLRDRDEMEQLLRKHIPTQGNAIAV